MNFHAASVKFSFNAPVWFSADIVKANGTFMLNIKFLYNLQL